ncbi:hypothetical protein SARC_09936 [Sphaeroforma arctica JP610]|uniref:Uncharacterized protein n=1 Tax=Sphaeroforma arctica JP610 TaxID=667725 RepID=A0A0L0FLF3_9EUKA|nr:hypothetical protein SARC_09936 [Sphaeroforma arctica JP610]KNC77604.1 hypothetical protein SARC_09936 [Sphaeroforma arctica JP610]|eukprot:XP_014151506.1 hypothetical protein SARC_09936 [Sphaeroforma arctica JP610]
MSASPSSTPSSTMSASASSTSSSTMSTSPSSTPSSTLVASPSSTASIPPSLEPSSSPAASQSPRPSISPTATSTVLGPLEPTSQCRRPPQGKPVYHIRSYYHRFCTSRKNGNYYPEIDQDCSEQENKFIWHPGHWNRFVLLNENLGLTDHCISVSDYETFKATYPLFTGPTDDSTMQDLIPGECEGEYVKWGTTDHPTLPIEDEVVKIVSVDLEFNGEPVCLAARPVTMPEDQYYIAECDHDNPDIWWKFERLCDIDADYDLSITPE